MIASIGVDPYITRRSKWDLVHPIERVAGRDIVTMDGKRVGERCCWGLHRVYQK